MANEVPLFVSNLVKKIDPALKVIGFSAKKDAEEGYQIRVTVSDGTFVRVGSCRSAHVSAGARYACESAVVLLEKEQQRALQQYVA